MTRWVAAVGTALLAIAGCGGSGSAPDTVTVLAASSLTEAFAAIGEDFEAEHPDIDIDFNFAASSELAVQIREGAPADAFASADEANMQKVVDSGDVTGEPAIFARNRLEIAVEPGNPENIDGLADLAEPDLVVILCAAQVPCGHFADEALSNAGVSVTPASRAENVKAALTPVELGEADAAIVYATDVRASDAVAGVAIPDAEDVVAAYPIAPLADGDVEAARRFIRFVQSRHGQQVLREFGFLAP